MSSQSLRIMNISSLHCQATHQLSPHVWANPKHAIASVTCVICRRAVVQPLCLYFCWKAQDFQHGLTWVQDRFQPFVHEVIILMSPIPPTPMPWNEEKMLLLNSSLTLWPDSLAMDMKRSRLTRPKCLREKKLHRYSKRTEECFQWHFSYWVLPIKGGIPSPLKPQFFCLWQKHPICSIWSIETCLLPR